MTLTKSEVMAALSPGDLSQDKAFDKLVETILSNTRNDFSANEKQEIRAALSNPEFGFIEDFRRIQMTTALLTAVPDRSFRVTNPRDLFLNRSVQDQIRSSVEDLGIEFNHLGGGGDIPGALMQNLADRTLESYTDSLEATVLSFKLWPSPGNPLVSFTLQTSQGGTIVDHAYPYYPVWKRGGRTASNGDVIIQLKPQTYIFRGTLTGNTVPIVDTTQVPVSHSNNTNAATF